MADGAVTAVATRPNLGALGGLTGSPLLRLAVRRLLLLIPIVLGVSLLTFWVLSRIPGSAGQLLLGPEATPAEVAAFDSRLGLDLPGPVRYLRWLGGLLHGDLGVSIASGQPVSGLLADRLPVTGSLVGYAFVVSVVVAVPVACLAAHRPGGLVDRVTVFVSTAGLAVANYVLALLMVLVFAVGLGWLPAIGYVSPADSATDHLRSLVLPVIAIALPLACFYLRFLRGDLVDQLQDQEYVTTARAKGISGWAVLRRHALRNSAFGLITVDALNLGTVIGSTVIIEQIFALPGLGQLLLQAINARDVVVVQACVLVFAVVAVLANLVADLLHAALDPRVRHGSG